MSVHVGVLQFATPGVDAGTGVNRDDLAAGKQQTGMWSLPSHLVQNIAAMATEQDERKHLADMRREEGSDIQVFYRLSEPPIDEAKRRLLILLFKSTELKRLDLSFVVDEFRDDTIAALELSTLPFSLSFEKNRVPFSDSVPPPLIVRLLDNKKLTSLDAWMCKLDDDTYRAVARNTTLIELTGVRVVGYRDGFEHLADNKTLKALGVHHYNAEIGLGPLAKVCLFNRTIIAMDFEDCPGIGSEAIRIIAQNPVLQQLRVSGTGGQDRDYALLLSMPDLVKLDVVNCAIGDKFFSALSGNHSLRTLDISSGRVNLSRSNVQAVRKNASLKELTLYTNQLRDREGRALLASRKPDLKIFWEIEEVD